MSPTVALTSHVTSQMTSPVRHHLRHHDETSSRRNVDDADDSESSLSTPPLPSTSKNHQPIKAEPLSPSAARHVTSGQGQGQIEEEAVRTFDQGRRFGAAAFSGQGRSQGQNQVDNRGQGQTQIQGRSRGQGQGQGQGREAVTSLVNTTSSTSTAASEAASLGYRSSMIEFDSDPSSDTSVMTAKHARLDLNTTWQHLD